MSVRRCITSPLGDAVVFGIFALIVIDVYMEYKDLIDLLKSTTYNICIYIYMYVVLKPAEETRRLLSWKAVHQ